LWIAYERGSASRRSAIICVVVALGLGAWYVAGTLSGASTPGPPPAAVGNVVNKPVPPAIASLTLENQEGQPVTLDQFEGHDVLLAPFLTSCQEECPITTAALLDMERAIKSDGLSKKVVILEVTVDPGRDTPGRMKAYANLTGSDWPLLTGSPSTLASLWKWFGVYYQKVAEGTPPGIDWQTHQPYTYDVDHSDGFVLLDTDLHERFIAGGMAKIGEMPADLHKLLDSQGVTNLKKPGAGTWTVTDGLNAIGWLLGQSVPSTS
jgi:cytochrome oxidase Cu insertion factor (SCO1/SenC/PrrC family)